MHNPSDRDDLLGTRPTRAIFTKFFGILPTIVPRSFSGGMTKFQGEGAMLGDFFPIDNALYSRAFGTNTKTAEQNMPLG